MMVVPEWRFNAALVVYPVLSFHSDDAIAPRNNATGFRCHAESTSSRKVKSTWDTRGEVSQSRSGF